MLLDKNGKLFGVISLVDTAILIFFIFAIGAGIYSLRENHSSAERLTVTVFAEDVTSEVAASLADYRGEYTDAQGNVMGTQVSADARQETVWITPTEDPGATEDPSASTPPPTADSAHSENAENEAAPKEVEVPVDNSFDVTIALSCPGREEDNYFLLSNGTAIAAGDLLILSGNGVRIQVTVTDVSPDPSDKN